KRGFASGTLGPSLMISSRAKRAEVGITTRLSPAPRAGVNGHLGFRSQSLAAPQAICFGPLRGQDRDVNSFMGYPQLIIFDLAGTTVQDNGEVPESFSMALAQYGVQVTPEQLRKVRGSSKKQAVSDL